MLTKRDCILTQMIGTLICHAVVVVYSHLLFTDEQSSSLCSKVIIGGTSLFYNVLHFLSVLILHVFVYRRAILCIDIYGYILFLTIWNLCTAYLKMNYTFIHLYTENENFLM